MDTTCCYARQDKIWVRDPDGTPWEVFATHEDAEAGDGVATRAECAAAVRAKGAATPAARERRELQLHDPQTLYRRWEDSQWSPFAIDLETDREQWPATDRRGARAGPLRPRSLMVAEERITTKFSGLVRRPRHRGGGAPSSSTQQVDEARHMQFYARFQDEVIADPAVIAAHVERAREQVSPAFRQIFDVALVEAHERLVAAPGDLAAKVRFVTIYHLILESTLGLTSFQFITDYLKREGLLPGFVDGYSKIHHDETATSATASGSCARRSRATRSMADVVRATLRDLLPAVAESLTPPERRHGLGCARRRATDDSAPSRWTG